MSCDQTTWPDVVLLLGAFTLLVLFVPLMIWVMSRDI